jgi:uncharacterized NAD(P)/FAD-binding protein YdhS
MPNRSDAPNHYDLLIIGGGFAACSALAWLARFGPAGLRLAVFTARGNGKSISKSSFGGSLAYTNQDPLHLLNAVHANMGLLDSEMSGFTDWLIANEQNEASTDFVSRASYGSFLAEQWQVNLAALKAKRGNVKILERDAVAIEAITHDRVCVLDETGVNHQSLAVLVCEGPIFPEAFSLPHPRLIAPIWPSGLTRLAGAHGHVAIIGSGLSGIDATISALAKPDITKITIISRDGRLPLGHDITRHEIPDISFTGSACDVLRTLKSACTALPWQSVMNALRRQSNTLWHSWTVVQRRQALRHLGALWATHRNRLPHDVSVQINAAQENGSLEVIKAEAIAEIRANGDLVIQVDHANGVIQPDWLIDARGFARVTSNTDSVCGLALRDGHFVTSRLGYGVAANERHRTTSAQLAPIHVVGAARLGDLIETTGAPEVRAQVRETLEALFQ